MQIENAELNICKEKTRLIEFKELTTLLLIIREQFVWTYF
jgi:hypothetical protein